MLQAQDLDIKIDTNLSLNYNAYLSFEVEETHHNQIKSTERKTNKNRLKWSHIDVKVTGGTYYKKGLLKIDSGKDLNEKGEITIEVTYNKKTISKTVSLAFNEIQIINFNGKNAKKKRSNSFLGQLFRGLVSEATGVELTPVPKNGKSGKKGEHAGIVTIDLDTVHINHTVILKAVCIDKTHGKKAVAYVNPKLSIIKIMAEGGNGSSGTDGEAYNPDVHGQGYEKSGLGGHGGKAGSGGYVEVYTNQGSRPYINALLITTSGGTGGNKGRSMRHSSTSLKGADGLNGHVVYISKD